MENEVKEVTYLAVAAMVLSLVLSFALYIINVNNNLADIRNGQIQSNQQLKQYNLYNKYDRNTLIGDEVVECIRLYYDSGISIFVDSRTNDTVHNATVDASHTKLGINGNSTATCGATGCTDHRIYNLHQYTVHLHSGTDYFALRAGVNNNNKSAMNDIRNWFPTERRYRAYLVYNNQDVVEFYNALMQKYRNAGGSTTNIDINKLDSKLENVYPGSEVSGIVLIKIA